MASRSSIPSIALTIVLAAWQVSAATREEILEHAVLVADRLAEVKVVERRWQDAPYLVGSMLVWEQLGCPGSPACERLRGRVEEVVAVGNRPVGHGDWAAYAQAALDLYRLTAEDETAIRAARLQVTEEPLRFAGLVVEHDAEAGAPLDPWWVADGYGSRYWQDDLFMVVPWLAMLGSGCSTLPAEDSALDLAYEWIEAYAFDHRKSLEEDPDRKVPSRRERRRSGWSRGDPTSGRLLLDVDSGLWWHDENHPGGDEFWGRGNGWVAAALVRAQHFLDRPYGGLRYAQVLDRHDIRGLLERMARLLWLERNTYGIWGSHLLDHDGYPTPESSASALFTFMLARAVNEGWLDEALYAPTALKAFHALSRLVDADGDLHAIQPAAAGPASSGFLPSDEPSANLNFGAGAFLMAAAEISRIDADRLRTMEQIEAIVLDRSRFASEDGQLVIAISELGEHAEAIARASSLAAISGQRFLAASTSSEDGGLVRVEDGGSGEVAIFFEPTDAKPIGHRYLVPVVAATDGLGGTFWRSDLALHNPGPVANTIAIEFMPRHSSGQPRFLEVVVPPMAGVVLENLVEDSFGDSGTGPLHIHAQDELVLSSRTFTGGAGGTFGLHVPAFERSVSLVHGEEARLLGLGSGPDRRTNLGCANFAALDAEVRFTFHGLDGAVLGELIASVPKGGSWQRSQILKEYLENDGGAAYAVARVLTPGASVLPWASIVDTRTGDSSLVTAAAAARTSVQGQSGQGLMIPAAAHLPGLAGTVWRSDLAVHNPGSEAADFSLALLRTGKNNLEAAEHLIEGLAPGASLRLDDAVAEVFSAGTSGAIRVTPVRGTVMVASRTYNQTGDGTFGQAIRGVPARRAIRPGEVAEIPHLRHGAVRESGFRSNIGFVNLGTGPLEVSLELWSDAGQALGQRQVVLEPLEHRQLHDVLRPLTTVDQIGARATVRTVSTGGVVIAYASVVDNRTGDAIFLPARLVRTARQ